MAHYALLDPDNTVVDVIVGKDEDDVVDGIDSWEDYYGEVTGYVCKRTSYNTSGNQHSEGGTPFRGNYAEIGGTYDEVRDAFIPRQPYPSWVLSNTTLLWEPPVAYPDDGEYYEWDEATTSWVN